MVLKCWLSGLHRKPISQKYTATGLVLVIFRLGWTAPATPTVCFLCFVIHLPLKCQKPFFYHLTPVSPSSYHGRHVERRLKSTGLGGLPSVSTHQPELIKAASQKMNPSLQPLNWGEKCMLVQGLYYHICGLEGEKFRVESSCSSQSLGAEAEWEEQYLRSLIVLLS